VESVGQWTSTSSGDLESTGDPRVDSVLEGLAGLPGASPGEQVGVYELVQRGLQDCLAEADPAAAGSARPG
jgi:hypothetical protein